ncbi:dihydrofolate reductase family protein [Sphingomonas sp. CGMCC 1.13654]|uniref:Dihydrofolate reductase family protein n=1 Tax=Sphingomonas chungangi TaxID=2683589 RepID=A0A838LBM3_9SPHN|nr:dihydrofolate reductase family protein [Sphingomonas chungangi]MBA2935536.1 dihydrofolate reductase family protein [Sphingomonas chungangi]MVW54229.1 riboflavin deaminase [Sphingomonas chungangi]
MPDRPRIICLMSSSIDGGLHASRCTASPDGSVKDWSGLYEKLHGELGGDAWLVGRTTMAEMSKGEPHAPAEAGEVERPHHFAQRNANQYAIAVDTRGQLHFRGSEIGGDHAVVLLGGGVSDEHLAELTGDGVSYIVSENDRVDLRTSLEILRSELGIETLLLEGGAAINGSFLAEGLVDELHVVVSPTLDARQDMEAIVSHGEDGLKGRVQLSLLDCRRLDRGAVHLKYAVTSA